MNAPVKSEGVNVSVYARTDVGMRRQGNEDSFLIADLTTGRLGLGPEVTSHQLGVSGSLMIVSDGLGGAAAGEVASAMAVQTVCTELMKSTKSVLSSSDRLKRSTEQANEQIWTCAQSDNSLRGMGATLTAAFVQGNCVYIAQVGDSRAYIVRGGQVKQVTEDQSWANAVKKAGLDTNDVPHNVILQALGTQPRVHVEVTSVELRNGDLLILCSDGLSNKIKDEEMRDIVSSAPDLPEACRQLVDLANKRGGEDNITVIIARFEGEMLPKPAERQSSITSTFKVVTPLDFSENTDGNETLSFRAESDSNEALSNVLSDQVPTLSDLPQIPEMPKTASLTEPPQVARSQQVTSPLTGEPLPSKPAQKDPAKWKVETRPQQKFEEPADSKKGTSPIAETKPLTAPPAVKSGDRSEAKTAGLLETKPDLPAIPLFEVKPESIPEPKPEPEPDIKIEFNPTPVPEPKLPAAPALTAPSQPSSPAFAPPQPKKKSMESGPKPSDVSANIFDTKAKPPEVVKPVAPITPSAPVAPPTPPSLAPKSAPSAPPPAAPPKPPAADPFSAFSGLVNSMAGDKNAAAKTPPPPAAPAKPAAPPLAPPIAPPKAEQKFGETSQPNFPIFSTAPSAPLPPSPSKPGNSSPFSGSSANLIFPEGLSEATPPPPAKLNEEAVPLMLDTLSIPATPEPKTSENKSAPSLESSLFSPPSPKTTPMKPVVLQPPSSPPPVVPPSAPLTPPKPDLFSPPPTPAANEPGKPAKSGPEVLASLFSAPPPSKAAPPKPEPPKSAGPLPPVAPPPLMLPADNRPPATPGTPGLFAPPPPASTPVAPPLNPDAKLSAPPSSDTSRGMPSLFAPPPGATPPSPPPITKQAIVPPIAKPPAMPPPPPPQQPAAGLFTPPAKGAVPPIQAPPAKAEAPPPLAKPPVQVPSAPPPPPIQTTPIPAPAEPPKAPPVQTSAARAGSGPLSTPLSDFGSSPLSSGTYGAKSKGNSKLLMFGLGGALIGVLGIGGAVVYFTGKGDDKPPTPPAVEQVQPGNPATTTAPSTTPTTTTTSETTPSVPAIAIPSDTPGLIKYALEEVTSTLGRVQKEVPDADPFKESNLRRLNAFKETLEGYVSRNQADSEARSYAESAVSQLKGVRAQLDQQAPKDPKKKGR